MVDAWLCWPERTAAFDESQSEIDWVAVAKDGTLLLPQPSRTVLLSRSLWAAPALKQ